METTETISFIGAFTAGALSFLTPCVLPLVPVYLSILSGTSFNQMIGKEEISAAETREIHKRVLVNAVMFILGFSLVFTALGLVSAEVGNLLAEWGGQFLRVIGLMLILFGLNMTKIWKPRFLNLEARFQVQKGKLGLLSSLLIGAAFAFGWTPCVGPFLAPILAVAASSTNKAYGAALLATYSLGLGVPFFLSALSVNGLIAFSNKWKKHFDTVELIIGTLLLWIGVFLLIGGIKGLDLFRGLLEAASG